MNIYVKAIFLKYSDFLHKASIQSIFQEMETN